MLQCFAAAARQLQFSPVTGAEPEFFALSVQHFRQEAGCADEFARGRDSHVYRSAENLPLFRPYRAAQVVADGKTYDYAATFETGKR